MTAVFRHTSPFLTVDQGAIEKLKAHALLEPLRRSRILLHHDEVDAVQQMIVCLHEHTQLPPTLHHGKSKSIHMVEGRCRIVFFDDAGHKINEATFAAAEIGRPFCYRITEDVWQITYPETEFAIFHEIIQGPFVRPVDPPHWVTGWLDNIDQQVNFDAHLYED